eukprot:CAMPEP_0198301290 /NCGR_PEP_ID=MMETSP1449-20131203/51021_1 /TAXON_ID=420275 /ORGANISM="Attheya septentrionalis, Strain CCMP2084" /LENGTH=223 /DNA_ID=CAMNT_0044003329 /DNA_START=21 /DNA_END=692 /DNA_ORIENTATION=+
MADKDEMSAKELFGGGMSIRIPPQWRDVSDIRQVPDHQEVFQNIESSTTELDNAGGSGCCFVIDLLDRIDTLGDDDAAVFYFKDLAEANDAINVPEMVGSDDDGDENHRLLLGHTFVTEVGASEEGDWIRQLGTVCNACCCNGWQHTLPGARTSPNASNEEDRVWVRVELCVIRLKNVETDVLVTLSTPSPNGPDTGTEATVLSPLFLSIVSTLEVKDWGLFG